MGSWDYKLPEGGPPAGHEGGGARGRARVQGAGLVRGAGLPASWLHVGTYTRRDFGYFHLSLPSSINLPSPVP